MRWLRSFFHRDDRATLVSLAADLERFRDARDRAEAARQRAEAARKRLENMAGMTG